MNTLLPLDLTTYPEDQQRLKFHAVKIVRISIFHTFVYRLKEQPSRDV